MCTRKEAGVDVIVRCGSNDLVDPNTEARIVCQMGYQSTAQRKEITVCRLDGSWSRSISPCKQICGEEGPEGIPYIIGGESTNNTRVPWHVGIYRLSMKYSEPDYTCGGTILNAKVVISAIHCFWNTLAGGIYPGKIL